MKREGEIDIDNFILRITIIYFVDGAVLIITITVSAVEQKNNAHNINLPATP